MLRDILFAALFTCLIAAGAVHADTVLITGADRGIGLEFARQYAARGDTVIATCRHPAAASELRTLAARKKTVTVERLDVRTDHDIDVLALKYQGKAIDVLINNAGILGNVADQTLGTLSRPAFHKVMDVNVYGALAVSQAFRANVAASSHGRIIALTSGLGSIGVIQHLKSPPTYYSISKAALNMGMQALASALKSSHVIVALIAPGAVDTAMFASFTADYHVHMGAISPVESVSKMMAVIDHLDPEKASKGVISYDGSVDPW